MPSAPPALHRLGLSPHPRSPPQESRGREDLPGFLNIQKISRQLHAHKLIVRNILVERLNDPIAIGIGAIERHIPSALGIKAAHIVFGIAGNVQPVSAPPLPEPR